MDGFFKDIPKPFKQFFGESFWNNFDNMFQELEKQQNNNQNQFQYPLVNMYETGNELLCILSLPGLDRIKDINLLVNHSILTVSGRIHLPFSQYSVVKEEISQGNFKRDISLPYPVREDKVNATYKRGLLFVYLHRLISNQTQNGILIKDLDEE